MIFSPHSIIDHHSFLKQGEYRERPLILLPATASEHVRLFKDVPNLYFSLKVNNHPKRVFIKRFNSLLQPVVSEAYLSIEVSIWDDFHDRCMISDLIGVSLSNGFDVSLQPDDITTWTRLSRIDRDDLQREFDPASGRNKKHGGFTICS